MNFVCAIILTLPRKCFSSSDKMRENPIFFVITIFQNTFDEDIVFLSDSSYSCLLQKLVLQIYILLRNDFTVSDSPYFHKNFISCFKNKYPRTSQKNFTENIQCRYSMCLAIVSGVFILLLTVSLQIPQNRFRVLK